jgi:hypothetical protein
MSELTRREVVRRASGVAIGSTLAGSAALASDSIKANVAPQPAAKPVDPLLANSRPEVFMLSEPQVFRLEGDGHSRDLIITSARDADGNRTKVRVPSSALRIFRIDASVDDFTRNGGFYWQFFGKAGKTQMKTRAEGGLDVLNGDARTMGDLVMVIREGHDTVRCYTMTLDFRC